MFMEHYDILCLTPQILVNNLETGAVGSLAVFSLLILDECHHTKGSEPYHNLMKKYLLEKMDGKRKDLPQVNIRLSIFGNILIISIFLAVVQNILHLTYKVLELT